MEEEDGEGAPTQGIGGVERLGLVDIVRQQDTRQLQQLQLGVWPST